MGLAIARIILVLTMLLGLPALASAQVSPAEAARQAQRADDKAAASETTEPAAADAPTEPQSVTVGYHGTMIYDVSVSSGTYYLSGYLWFRWQGEIDPSSTFELANAVDQWGLTKEPLQEEPSELADGSKYQIFRIQGRFYDPFNLSQFPLDRQVLPLLVEDSTYATDQLLYVPDTKESGLSRTLTLPGWTITGLTASSAPFDYGTTFGEGVDAKRSNYSQVRFEIGIERPVNFFIWKLLLPLVIVLLANWAALLLPPRLADLRLPLPATCLLTTVFLQQSYSGSLPDSGSLVLLDKIYVLAYGLIVVTLAQIILSTVQMALSTDGNLDNIRRAEHRSLAVQLLFFTAALAGLILWR